MEDSNVTRNAADLRARRRHLRDGGRFTADSVREDQGCDFDAPDRESALDFGYTIEPFNMRRENTEGHFDEDGMYIEHKEDMKKLRDAWLDTVDQGHATAKIDPKDVNKLSDEQKRLMDTALVYEKITNDDEEEVGEMEPPIARIDVRPFVYELCVTLQPQETPSEAMRRLKKGGETDGTFTIRKKRKTEKGDAQPVSAPSAASTTKAPLDRVTELCDVLLQQGMYDIYTTPREDLATLLMVPAESVPEVAESTEAADDSNVAKPEQQPQPVGDGPFWQYKFPGSEETHGPFASNAMLLWKHHLVGKNLQVRCVSATGEAQEDIWREYESIDFALYS